MDFTGERYIPGKAFGEIETEHMHRYLALSDIVRDKVVLDAACGEGYGTYILSDNAKFVYGIDISEESIRHAKNRYKKDNIEYKQCSIEKLSFEDNSIDVVVSFETIEHVGEDTQEAFLKEIKRVLKKDGILIISTPDKYIYSDIPKYKNEYHLREFYFYEFRDFLNKYFKNISFYNQDFGTFGIIKSYDNKDNSYFKHINSQDIAVNGKYIIAICSEESMDNVGSILSIYRHANKSANDVEFRTSDILQVFWDDGTGFNEANSVKVPYKYIDEFQIVQLELPNNASGKLRIDIGNSVALTEIKSICVEVYSHSDNETRHYNANIVDYCNMIYIGEEGNCYDILSLTEDPQLFLDYYIVKELNERKAKILIDFKVLPLTINEALGILKEKYSNNIAQNIKLKEQVRAKNEEIEKLKKEIEVRNEEIRKQKQEIEARNEEIRKQKQEIEARNEEIRKQKQEIEAKDEEIRKQKQEIGAKDEEIRKQKTNIDIFEKEISEILNSTSWHITKPLRYLGKIVKK